MDTLLSSLSNWRPFTALVFGDFMLDQYVYGDAERLSADAPVPVLHVRRTEHRPGGSANLCLDLSALRGRVCAFGATGADPAATQLRQALSESGIESSGLIQDPARPTTLKQNLVGLAQARHPQKMFRVDYESREPLDARTLEVMVAAFEKALPTCDVVCIEDYNKGVCTRESCQRIIAAAREAGKPVFVDPAKLADYSKYRGATAITPNRNEAEHATGASMQGDSSVEHNTKIASKLLESLDLDAVVLTLDKQGALLLNRDGHAHAIPTVARQVYDVTGAGDMFLAGLAAARANDISWVDSVRFANAAAGLEVEIFGVQPIPFERVHHSILVQSRGASGKLRTLDELTLEIAANRKLGKKIIFTNGCFDVLHAGHVTLLANAAAVGCKGGDAASAFLIVGINDDASVRRLKGPSRPINTQEDRARVIGALEAVGCVAVFSQDTPLELIQHIKPDVLVKGADYTKEKVVGGDFVESYGGRVELIPLVEGRSTTATIALAAAKSL